MIAPVLGVGQAISPECVYHNLFSSIRCPTDGDHLNGKIVVLIEAKAIGTELKDQHVKQAIDYAANQGVEWVVLTNAAQWRIYNVLFGKPIAQDLVCEFDFLSLSSKDEAHLQFLFLLTKEGWSKSAVVAFNEQKQALSRFFIGASILSEPVLSAVRRELKRVSPDVRIELDQIRAVILQDVIKREIVDSEKFGNADRALARSAAKALRAKKPEQSGISNTSESATAGGVPAAVPTSEAAAP